MTALRLPTSSATVFIPEDCSPESAEISCPDRAESLIDTHVDGVLSLLEDDGVLTDRSDLLTSVENDLRGIVRGEQGTAMFRDPEKSEELKIVKASDEGTLTVTVQPESNRAFAILDTGDGRTGYSIEKGRFDFDVQDHDCSCQNILCSTGVCSEECCDYDGNCHYSCDCYC